MPRGTWSTRRFLHTPPTQTPAELKGDRRVISPKHRSNHRHRSNPRRLGAQDSRTQTYRLPSLCSEESFFLRCPPALRSHGEVHCRFFHGGLLQCCLHGRIEGCRSLLFGQQQTQSRLGRLMRVADFNNTTSSTTGTSDRRDCFAASRATRRQRSTRAGAAWTRCFSLRRAVIGINLSAPSSVAFSMIHSMRSNLKIESKSVTGSAGLRFHLGDQRKSHRVSTDPGNDSTPYAIPRHHVTLHAGLRTQHPNQVSRLLPLERSGAVVPVVGNPPPSRHRSTVSSERCHGPVPLW